MVNVCFGRAPIGMQNQICQTTIATTTTTTTTASLCVRATFHFISLQSNACVLNCMIEWSGALALALALAIAVAVANRVLQPAGKCEKLNQNSLISHVGPVQPATQPQVNSAARGGNCCCCCEPLPLLLLLLLEMLPLPLLLPVLLAFCASGKRPARLRIELRRLIGLPMEELMPRIARYVGGCLVAFVSCKESSSCCSR